MLNVQTWIERGRGLGCFRGDVEQARYLLAWRRGDVGTVKSMLSGVFRETYPLELVNYSAFADLCDRASSAEDGPPAPLEEWTELDFSAQLYTGERVSCAWLASSDGGLSDESLKLSTLCVCKGILSERTVAQKSDRILRAHGVLTSVTSATGSSLSDLVLAASIADFLVHAAPSSEALQALVLDLDEIPDLLLGLRDRAGVLIGLWRDVLSHDGDSGPLTYGAIDSCSSIQELEEELQRCEGPANRNLLTYLTARDA